MSKITNIFQKCLYFSFFESKNKVIYRNVNTTLWIIVNMIFSDFIVYVYSSGIESIKKNIENAIYVELKLYLYFL